MGKFILHLGAEENTYEKAKESYKTRKIHLQVDHDLKGSFVIVNV
jgi:hypothetical protein